MQSQDDARLDNALDELKQAETETPRDLRPAIMEAVRRQPAVAAARISGTGGGLMTRKMMLGLAAAAAVVFAILLVTGFPPELGNIQATIGQANRYTAPQIAEGDANIGDPAVQQFLQSDTFAALVKDREAMKILTDPKIREALANQELLAELSNPDLAEALSALEVNGVFRQLTTDADLMHFISSDLVHYVQDPSVMHWLNDAELLHRLSAASAELRNGHGNLVRILGNADFAAYLSAHSDLATALSKQSMLKALSNVNFVTAIRMPVFASAFNSEAFLHAIASPGFAQAISSEAMLHAFSNAAFTNAVRSPAFAQAIAAADLRLR